MGTKIEDVPVNMLKVGVELEQESVPAEITKMQARVQQRINRLKQTKMAPEKLLNETFSRQALENLSPEEETQLLREIYRRKYYTDLKNLKEALERLTDEAKVAEYLRVVNKLMTTAEQQLAIEGSLDFENVAEYNTRLGLFTGLEELISVIEKNPILKN